MHLFFKMLRIYCIRFLFVIKHFRTYLFLLFVICMLITSYIIALIAITHKHVNVKTDCLILPTQYHYKYLTPTVKIYGIKPKEKTLDIVKSIFYQMGYNIGNSNTTSWEILWSHVYPFQALIKELAYLKPHQKVNHFPGSGYITKKSNLAKLGIEHIPKSFILPLEKPILLKFTKKYNNKLWVLKSSFHRGIKILNDTENLDNDDNIFIQEFIKNPFLISGRKFDIGVYVILTSIDPLRVYVYFTDILLRFCTKEYHPFDINSPESYVVGDDYLPIWDVPDLKFLYSYLNYTAKESLNAYIQSKGKNPKKLWSQIYSAIQEVYFHTEENIKKTTMMFGNLRNFFELVRFDFVIDEDLNVYLLEVNMSPNLSAAHFLPNKLLYEQVLFNSLNIAGLSRKFPSSYVYRGELEVSHKDIQVYSDVCASKMCQISCKKIECHLCNKCMTKEMKLIAAAAYLEFINKGNYRRLIPMPEDNESIKYFQINNLRNMTEMNRFMKMWFHGKCLQDLAWCQ